MSLLEICNITKNFGALKVLEGFSMNVAGESGGEIRALIGPNGAGKTTLFNIISGILKASSGRIIFNDVDTTFMRSETIASLGVARTFQVSKLFEDITVRENVLIGMHSRYKYDFFPVAFRLPVAKMEENSFFAEADEYLAFVGLLEKANSVATQLPHGEQRLLEIARALASKPSLLLLDEPAAGLNSTEVKNLSRLLLEIKMKGISTILVEHDMQFVMEISDCITVLHRGIKIAEGKPNDIKINEDVIEAYLGKESLITEVSGCSD